MRLLDLGCGAGVGADGYHAAGFTDIVGVDVHHQPDYPYTFLRHDMLDVLRDRAFLSTFDLIHASPPCQSFTRAGHLRTAQGGTSKYPDLLTPALDLLRTVSTPWVVENVPGAPGMAGAVVECGSAYGLGVRRHRLFLSNRPLVGSGCDHKAQGRPWGVYHVMNDNVPQGGRTARDLDHGLAVMGVSRRIPWDALKEGFPPAYSHHIGGQIAALIAQGVTS